MKTRIAILIFGLATCGLTSFAQDDASAAAEAVTNAPAAEPASSEATPAQDETNAPTESAATNASTEAPAAVPQEATAAEPVEAAPTVVGAEDTNVPPAAVIPLIVMDDVPLTDAIKNLARQADINYMLDPKLTYGQPGPDGRVTPQPMVSIRWENVTAEQALSAMLNNYDLQLVEDPKTKIARVTHKDPAAPPPLVTDIIQLQYANPSNVVGAVQTIIAGDKRSKVIADVRTSQLVVVATEGQLDAVHDMIKRLDTMTKQVLIEAQLLETSMNPSTIKGINWSGTLQQQQVTFGNNALPGTPPTPATPSYVNPSTGTVVPATPATPGTIGGILSDPKLLMSPSAASFFSPATAFLNADGVSAVLSFINQNSEAKVLSSPRTVTLDNEKATLSVTRAVPIINVTAGTANTTGGSSITYTNLGVILNVTPRISANNYVNLTVIPEVSRIFDTISKNTASGILQADEYDIRRMETHVMIPSGNTLVLGGLVQDDQRFSSTKVPILGDLPGIGNAFRSHSKARQKSNLLVFVTPTIVQDSDYHPTKTDFLNSTPSAVDDSKWSAWDNTTPYDWSKQSQQANAPVYQDLPK